MSNPINVTFGTLSTGPAVKATRTRTSKYEPIFNALFEIEEGEAVNIPMDFSDFPDPNEAHDKARTSVAQGVRGRMEAWAGQGNDLDFDVRVERTPEGVQVIRKALVADEAESDA